MGMTTDEGVSETLYRKIMRRKPKEMYFVTSTQETTIIFEVMSRTKPIEQTFTFKGEFVGTPTHYNIAKFLYDNLGDVKL
jgi:hypothetical protein